MNFYASSDDRELQALRLRQAKINKRSEDGTNALLRQFEVSKRVDGADDIRLAQTDPGVLELMKAAYDSAKSDTRLRDYTVKMKKVLGQ